MQASTIYLTLKDGQAHPFAAGVTGAAVARSLGARLAKAVLAMKVDGRLCDLSTPLHRDATLQLLTWQDKEGQQVFWHSTAHLLAEALQTYYPEAKLAIGPPIAQGFYYDVDFGKTPLRADDLPRLERHMEALALRKVAYERLPISKQAAVAHYTRHYNPYKLELLERLADGQITFYRQGDLVDLCKGPHVPHTGFIKAVKLLNTAGAYWQGDATRQQLTRLYGISFPSRKMLQEHLERREAAQERDHRKLGKALGWFTFSEEVGLGLPLWLPQGTLVREKLTAFLKRAQEQGGYQPIMTPHIGEKALYVRSGHYQKYGADTFQPIRSPQEGKEFLLKPMNCPHHCIVYKSAPRSYKELPIRYAEFGMVYRYEQHGELHGLVRTRAFTQDDAHIFCTNEQVHQELERVIDLVLYVFKQFQFTDYQAHISVRDPKRLDQYIGEAASWQAAETALQQVSAAKGLSTTVMPGEAAFYGPKLDFMVRDALGRQWQLGTVQLDYQLPERFELTYVGPDNRLYRPVMIHRAPFGSIERFVGLLLEHTGGRLPLWLAPEQARLLPVSAKYSGYAAQLHRTLRQHELRVHTDERDGPIRRKIRDAETAKVPYMLLVGEREQQAGQVAVRKHGAGDQGVMPVDKLVEVLAQEAAMPLYDTAS